MGFKFAEQCQACECFLPVDLGTSGATGDWVSLKNYGKLVILIFKKVGTTAENPVYTLSQATAVAGTGTKALNITEYWRKSAPTNLQTNSTAGTWTRVTQAAGNTVTGVGINAELYAIEVNAEDLDTDAGFDCVQCSSSDPGTTGALAAALYLLLDPRYPQETIDSGIID